MNQQFVLRQIDPEETGMRIRRFRKEQGLTVADMGNLIRVTSYAIYRWERGATLPDLGNVPNLCGVLQKRFEDIFVCKGKEEGVARP